MALRSARLATALVALGCADSAKIPECGSKVGRTGAMLAGPDEAGFDAALAAHAHQYDRQFHGIHALATGLNTELVISRSATAARELLTAFMAGSGFDVGAPPEQIGKWAKATGAYAGAGMAADAFRYGVLRDSGEACADVEIARAQLVRGLEGLHKAVEITGAPGVIARSVVNVMHPHLSHGELTPLFDEMGRALPLEKDNGTWRADFSGKNLGWIWEDSISRDMLVGWTLGLGPAWEVIEEDPSIDASLKDRLRADALAIGQQLRVVRPSGHDLEIIDADGRTTFHGYLNEFAFERGFYLETPENGFHASLALGIVSVLAMVSGDAGLRSYLVDELVTQRRLPEIAATSMLFNQLGEMSNFSGYNMSFSGSFLAHRYVDHAGAEATMSRAIHLQLYDVPGQTRQPKEMKQSFFDFVFAASSAGRTRKIEGGEAFDQGAIARGAETLREFPAPPYWERARTNCDEAEIAAARCTLDDGTVVGLLGEVGRGDNLVADVPIPMRVRPSSNFWWRSNPYIPNGDGSGEGLYGGPDFRLAYWMGRYIR